MQLQRAISDLHWIHERLRFAERASCFRPGTIALVGVSAILAGWIQPHVALESGGEPWTFFLYWTSVATAIVLAVGLQIAWRYAFRAGERERWLARQSLLDFAPCLMVGGVLSLSIMLSTPQHAVLLPAIWCSCFSLGIFSLRHRLPEAMLTTAGFYMLCGMLCVHSSVSAWAYSPWTVGLPFGIGHFLTAGILYHYERVKHAQ